jgi:hypothetical protein
LHSSSHIIRILKSENTRWAEYVKQSGEKRNVHKISVRKTEERDNSVDLVVNGRIILKLILIKGIVEIMDWIHLA